MVDNPGAPAPTKTSFQATERLIILILAIVMVLFLMAIVLLNQSLTRPAFTALHVLLALTAGALGAFLPTAVFQIEGQVLGLTARAGGAAAFFLIVFYGLPYIMNTYNDDGPVLRAPQESYLRTTRPNDHPEAGAVALILPVGFTDRFREEAVIEDLQASVRGRQTLEFTPLHFTRLQQGVEGDGWIPNTGNFMPPVVFAPNDSKEIAFYARDTTLTWGEFVRDVDIQNGALSITLHARLNDSRTADMECHIDARPLQQAGDELRTNFSLRALSCEPSPS